MMDWISSLLAFVANLVAQNSLGALLALSLVAALTEIGVPFPFIIDGALFITSYHSGLFSLQVLFVISALVLGRIAGATAIFWLSRYVGDAFIKWFSKRFPKLKLNEKMVSLSARFNRRAALAVAIARLTPGLLTPSSVAAGYCRTKYYPGLSWALSWHPLLPTEHS